jgi:hypothetical protein
MIDISLANRLLESMQRTYAILFKTFEDVCHHCVKHVQHLKVVLEHLHFNIKASELAQVPMRVCVFRAENRANFENALQVTANGHLLVKLWALCQTSGLCKAW